MNTIMTLNIATGKVNSFDSAKAVIEAYSSLSLQDKILTFVLGLEEEAMDYPAMMTYMLNMNNKEVK